MPKITVKCRGGKIEVEVDGVKGPSCTKATEFLTRLAGISPNDTEHRDKPEMYEQPANETVQ